LFSKRTPLVYDQPPTFPPSVCFVVHIKDCPIALARTGAF
jgi:hypothetical protein